MLQMAFGERCFMDAKSLILLLLLTAHCLPHTRNMRTLNIRGIEHASFTAIVLSATEGLAHEVTNFWLPFCLP